MGIAYIRLYDKQLFVALPFTAFDSSNTNLILVRKYGSDDKVYAFTFNEIASYFSEVSIDNICTEEL